jgi:spermidine synthase
LLLIGFPLAVGLALGTEHSWRLVNFYTARRYTQGGSYDDIEAQKRRVLTRLYDHEGADGYVAAYRDPDGSLLIQVGGKIEGTAAPDVPNAALLAYLPVAVHRDARKVLVIGLGAGVTVDVAHRIAPSVDLAEINGDVLEAVRLHGPTGLLDSVRVIRDDARNLLLKSEERWDVITSEPSYPSEYVVANLFSREFYRLASGRLAEGGVFCQWLPYYLMTNDEVTMMIKTFASVFPKATLWKVRGSMDRLLVGSMDAFSRDPGAIQERVARMAGGEGIAFDLSRDVEQVAEIARRPDVPINTDDRPRLEFSVARNIRVGDMNLVERR